MGRRTEDLMARKERKRTGSGNPGALRLKTSEGRVGILTGNTDFKTRFYLRRPTVEVELKDIFFLTCITNNNQ